MTQSYWTIQKKDGQKIGPISSNEVRESLRKGTIDLFDWVYKDNSKLTIRVLDVDEIFKNGNSGGSDSIYKDEENFNSDQYNQTKANLLPILDENSPRPDFSGDDYTKINLNFGSTGTNGHGTGSYSNTDNDNKQKINDRKYFVSNRPGSLTGPLTSQEIVQKYFKHSFPKDLYVLQKNNPVKVKMEDFVKTYMKYQSSVSRDIMLNNLFKERKSSKNLDNSINKKAAKPVVWTLVYKILGVALVLTVLILAVLIAYPRARTNLALSTKEFSSTMKKSPMSYEEESRLMKGSSPEPANTYQPQVQPQSQPQVQVQPQVQSDDSDSIYSELRTLIARGNKLKANRQKNKVKNKNTAYEEPDKTSDYQTEARQFLAPSTSQALQNSYTQTRPVLNQRQVSNVQQPAPNKTKQNKQARQSRPQQTQREQAVQLASNTTSPNSGARAHINQTANRVAASRNSSSPPSAQKGFSKDDLVPGTVVTLPNMGFSQIELNICPNKCTLNFYSNNMDIKGTFFKAAYANVLKNKTKVTITGTLLKNASGYKVIIQNIK